MFSGKFSCPTCGYGLPELEPRLFSFNSPVGACPDCDGLGVQRFFDPRRVVRHPHLSLAGGAVRGWDRTNSYYFQLIRSLARHYDFDIEEPFETLPERIRDIVLYGSRGRRIEFRYVNDRGGERQWRHAFEGIIPNMQRRYRETESNAVRAALGQYQSTQPCKTCGGARLNEAARHVFVGGLALPEVTARSVGDSLRFFAGLQLAGWRAEIADKIVKEIRDRLSFLADVGLEYLTLDRSAETLSGAKHSEFASPARSAPGWWA